MQASLGPWTVSHGLAWLSASHTHTGAACSHTWVPHASEAGTGVNIPAGSRLGALAAMTLPGVLGGLGCMTAVLARVGMGPLSGTSSALYVLSGASDAVTSSGTWLQLQ